MEKMEITYAILRDKGTFLGTNGEGTCHLYSYGGKDYIVLCDNSVITQKEDNSYTEGAIFPYSVD